MQNATKNKKTVQTIVGVVVGVAVYFAIQHFFFKPSFDKELMHVASELNKTCPIMVDKETRLDNAVALPGKVFQYNYTLVNMDASSIDVESLKKNLEPLLIQNVKTNPQLKNFRENKVTLGYNYKGRSGEFLFGMTVTPEKYTN